jgi:2,3-bisphosphoglycerate-independent phosphoglycerate mutase
MSAADKPAMNALASKSAAGLARTLFEGFPTGSDTANLSVLGYNPKKYYTGRSPIEAIGLDIPLSDDDTVFRLNLVTLSGEDCPFEEKTILDHSSGKITNEEAYALLDALRAEFETDDMRFYPGVSYRHIMVWSGIDYGYTMMPPHDILGRRVGPYMPGGPYGDKVLSMMKRSHEILSRHPVNLARMEKGLNPANCMWLWGEGKKPQLDDFKKKYGVSGSAITAVPLIKGLAKGVGLGSVDIPGATGDYYTNYAGKAEAALKVLQNEDFAFVHIEAPDECTHNGDLKGKLRAIEWIDSRVIVPLIEKLDAEDFSYRLLVLSDHKTLTSTRGHDGDPVPFLLYDSRKDTNTGYNYSEADGIKGPFVDAGTKLMGMLFEQSEK